MKKMLFHACIEHNADKTVTGSCNGFSKRELGEFLTAGSCPASVGSRATVNMGPLDPPSMMLLLSVQPVWPPLSASKPTGHSCMAVW